MRQGETAEAGAFPDTPDLVVIDGGRGQFEAAREVLAALGVKGVTLARSPRAPTAMPDGRPSSSRAASRSSFRPRDPALFFVQRLRDEAHRFAIGTHRARRKKEFVKSPLDEIPGIGPARKRALLIAFGSAKDVARAGLADLEKTPGLNAATAKLVYDFFHEAGGVSGHCRDWSEFTLRDCDVSEARLDFRRNSIELQILGRPRASSAEGGSSRARMTLLLRIL